jgi:putative phage-type endonuclease
MRKPILSEEHWHAMRLGNIGASDEPALFGVGYETEFDLWHRMKGDLPATDYSDNERVVLGHCLEPGIAAAARMLHGLDLKKADSYYTDDECKGLGATPDYLMMHDGQECPVEVKNASWGAFKDNWIIHEDGTAEPPLRYLIQVQTQLACCKADFAKLVALISGDRLVVCDIPRHEEAIAEIRRRTTAFWQSLADNIEPPAVMPQDLDVAKKVWTAGEGSVDLAGDPDVEQWLDRLADLRNTRKKIETDEDTIQGEVLAYCVRNGFAAIRANGGRISCKQMPAKQGENRWFRPQPSKIQLRITPAKL